MPICDICDQNAPVVASCGGTDCRLNLCPLDMTETGVCEDCAKEAPIACPPLSSELIAILLSGATIGSERLPTLGEALCARTRTEAASCDCVEIDDHA